LRNKDFRGQMPNLIGSRLTLTLSKFTLFRANHYEWLQAHSRRSP
jgi:hypothetical protein